MVTPAGAPPRAPDTGALVPLAACGDEPPGRVGRKAALLGWAAAQGLPTPGGFVIPADRFTEALEACDALGRARYLEHAALRLDPRHTFDVAASIASAMRSPAVEAMARADAEAAFARLGTARVVCRSSSPMEDGHRAAFPGVFLSVLGIDSPAALADAIVACWQSVFSADAMRYLLRLRVEPVDLSIAVLVQRHVEAAWCGVYVSVDPVDGTAGPRADLSDADPDALMSGAPAKLRAHRRDGSWTGVEAVPALSGPLEAVHLAAARLARHVEADVDVEFALPPGGADAPVILQCRPLTGLADATSSPGRIRVGDDRLHGRACAAGRTAGTARDPFVATTGDGGAPSSIAVVEQLTTADYGIVFEHAAVVAERDASALSHVAILCRELGVPLVCGIEDARARLIGRRISVDGRSGVVDVVDGEGPPRTGSARGLSGTPAAVTMTAAELLVRVLVEAGAGRPLAAEVDRIAARCARALGTSSVDVTGDPVAPPELEQLERLGAELLGPGFSAAGLLAEMGGRRLPPDPRRAHSGAPV